MKNFFCRYLTTGGGYNDIIIYIYLFLRKNGRLIGAALRDIFDLSARIWSGASGYARRGGEMILNVAIIEDERSAMEELKECLDTYAKARRMECRVFWWENPIDFIEKYGSEFDLVLLDTELPDMNGMDVAGKLRAMDGEVALIFVTNMAQYAIRGYEVDADDFIVKPVSYFDFAMKLDRIMRRLRGKKEARIVASNDGVTKHIPVSDIRYAEVIKHKVAYHTIDGEVFEVRSTLKKAEQQLPADSFARCSNYCLVNLRYVYSVKGYTLLLSRGRGASEYDTLAISRPRRQDFMKAFGKYLGENA